jgi:hypothetical protein
MLVVKPDTLMLLSSAQVKPLFVVTQKITGLSNNVS